jgi:hypothetical protein
MMARIGSLSAVRKTVVPTLSVRTKSMNDGNFRGDETSMTNDSVRECARDFSALRFIFLIGILSFFPIL